MLCWKIPAWSDALLYYVTHSPHGSELFSAVKKPRARADLLQAWEREKTTETEKQMLARLDRLLETGGYNTS